MWGKRHGGRARERARDPRWAARNQKRADVEGAPKIADGGVEGVVRITGCGTFQVAELESGA